MRSFRSDNNAGLVPEALDAFSEANAGHAVGYGDDEWTTRAEMAFRAVFGDDVAVFFVGTGTAANVLSIAALTEPWEQVVCHRHSHWNDDESTAPERTTHCRTTAVGDGTLKLAPEDLAPTFGNSRGDVHQPQPGVLTVSNITEFGRVYGPDEMTEVCDVAHAHGYRVHVDGARFANAVAALDCDPRSLTRTAGVDALSFGGTKNGLAFGEAVVMFPQGDGSAFTRASHAFPFHRKGTGHLLSKHRFVAAPFAAALETGAWLRHAAHANAMARRLADGLEALGIEFACPVEANALFVRLPSVVDQALQNAGHGYYPFGDADWGVTRLMCSFDTTADDVDAFVQDARGAIGD